MRGWLLLGGLGVLLIVLPIICLTGYLGDLAYQIGRIVLTIVLLLACAGTGLFGYICIRAQARKWGASLVVGAVLCVLVIFWLWTGHLLIFIL